MKPLRTLPSTDPFELITSARTEAAADWFELELFDVTVSCVVAPLLGPYVKSYIAVNRSVSCFSFAGSCKSEIGISWESSFACVSRLCALVDGERPKIV